MTGRYATCPSGCPRPCVRPCRRTSASAGEASCPNPRTCAARRDRSRSARALRFRAAATSREGSPGAGDSPGQAGPAGHRRKTRCSCPRSSAGTMIQCAIRRMHSLGCTVTMIHFRRHANFRGMKSRLAQRIAGEEPGCSVLAERRQGGPEGRQPLPKVPCRSPWGRPIARHSRHAEDVRRQDARMRGPRTVSRS